MGADLLALDIGGTKLAVAVVDRDGTILAEQAAPTDVKATPRQIVKTLLSMAAETMAQADVAMKELAAVGVSFGGPMNFPAGRTITCHHLPGWENFPLRDVVARRVGRPAVVDNDANAAALGEVRFGAARDCQHVLYLTVSTGVGGALVLDGRLHRGANSLAGEIGHTMVVADGPACTCGRRGCLEGVASGPAIARAAQEAIAAGERSLLAAIPEEELTARHVAEMAMKDALAARIVAQAGHYLGVAIAGAVNLVDPEMVVIGGGVSQAGEALFGPIRAAVSRLAAPESVRNLRILPGTLGQRGGLLGAAALALSECVAQGP